MRNLGVTKLVSVDPIVTSLNYSNPKEKLVKRKTIVHEVNIDPAMIRISGEKLKLQLFTKYWFFKPKSDEIQFVDSEIYYEPFIIVNGKYFIDYYRKRTYHINVEPQVKEIVLLNNKFIPENMNLNKKRKYIHIKAEERLTIENKAYMVLDKNGKKAVIEKVPSAPSSKYPRKVIKKYKIKELPKNFEVNLLKSKIARRPKDLCKIIKELFEITERTIIYAPRLKLRYKHKKTNQEKILILDGITAKKI